jgi:hypothetical protein
MTDDSRDWAAVLDEIEAENAPTDARLTALRDGAASRDAVNWARVPPTRGERILKLAYRPPENADGSLADSVPEQLREWADENRLVLRDAVTDRDREQLIVTFAPIEETGLAPQRLALDDLRAFAGADCTTREMLYGWLSEGGVANQDIADALGRSKQTVSDGVRGADNKRE